MKSGHIFRRLGLCQAFDDLTTEQVKVGVEITELGNMCFDARLVETELES